MEAPSFVSRARITFHSAAAKAKRVLTDLKSDLGLPSNRGEELQTKCLLELYGLKLADLQSKIRFNISYEYWLHDNCAYLEKQLFDWGMSRLPFPPYEIFVLFPVDADDQTRKKRDYED